MSVRNQQECKNPLVYQEVNSLICEYLELNGLEKTVSTFASECRAKALPCPFAPADQDTKASFSHYDSDRMLKSFDDGDQDGFFKMWRSFQAHIQSATSDMQKLEVYLRVHFALWPKAHREPESVQMQSMNQLKTFFEEYASKLSNDTSVLPLFALPYVSDPESHPIFRDLFHPDWTVKLRVQLEITVRRYFDLLEKNISEHSKLVSLVLKSHDPSLATLPAPTTTTTVNTTAPKKPNDLAGAVNSDYYRDRFFQLVETYRKIRKLLKGTRDSYGKLLKVSNELISALELSVNGQGIALDPILQKCNLIFPEIFTPMDSINRKPDMEYFKALATGPCFDKMLDSDVSLFFLGISDMNPDSLDYPKIKTVLSSDEVNYTDKLVLLQALRWLLTKTTTKCRQDAMYAFIAKDLIGLSDKSIAYRNKIFSVMLSPNPTYIKECFSRLLNAFASSSSGRKYMSVSNYCLEILVKSLLNYKDESEAFICQMIVATLQKLSLRKKMRLGMIERKVIQWLISQLKIDLVQQQREGSTEKSEGQSQDQKPGSSDGKLTSQFKSNPYLMEYSWALLMNLCLHDEATGPITSIAPDILTCLVQTLLNQPSKEVAPYVISTLYSILRIEQIFDMAKRMQLETVFASLLQQTDSEIAMHLHQVLAILYVRGRDRLASSSEVDYDDEENPDPEDFELELELNESWTTVLDEHALLGDDLLLRQYMATNGTEDAVIPLLTPKTLEHEGIHKRPTTPKAPDHRIQVSQQKISVHIQQTFSEADFPVQKETEESPGATASNSNLRRKNSKESQNIVFSSIKNSAEVSASSSKGALALETSYEQIPLTKGKIPILEAVNNNNGKRNPMRKSQKQIPALGSGNEPEILLETSDSMQLGQPNNFQNGSGNEPNHNKFESEFEKPVTKSPKVKRMVKKSKKVRT